MTNDYMKRTRTQVRNGYGVETTPQNLADVFAVYDSGTRARMLNDMDQAESFEGETLRETADNMSLRMTLEEMHQALIKAGR
jgi:hypothetical protein